MKKLFFILCLLFISWSVIFPMDVNALEKPTHSSLNGVIVNQNKASLNTYLNYSLGFSKGIEEIVNGKQIIQWIQGGGQYEDEPFYTRSFNHFHNPLLSWDQAGFGGTFKSAILWAQDQGSFGSLFGGNYSWKAVRDYYYLGLTSSTKTDREKNLADTFRGLGQLMHLVEDMSVPAHTRNDGHVFYNYEKWVDKISADSIEFPKLLSNPIFFGGTINGISSFFDTDQYNGGNPQDTLLNTVGIAEYTNANYFSDDTILNNNPTPDQTFPYPRVSSANTQICEDYVNGSTDKRKYISRNIAGLCPQAGSGQVDHFATVSLLNEESLITNDNTSNLRLWLDDNVHNTYAKELLPRAVGYSAVLLNYFFRGDIDMAKVMI